MRLYEITDLFADSSCEIEVHLFDYAKPNEHFKLTKNDCFELTYKGNVLEVPIYLANTKALRCYIEDSGTISVFVYDDREY